MPRPNCCACAAAAEKSVWRTGRPTASSVGLFATIGKAIAPPPGVRSPALWGTRARINELFERHAGEIRTAQRHFVFRYQSPAHWIHVFKSYYGPMLKAFAALDAQAQAALENEIVR